MGPAQAPLHIPQHACQIEKGRQLRHSLDDISYGLGLQGMHGPEQSTKQSHTLESMVFITTYQGGSLKQLQDNQVNDNCCQSVNDDIDQMVSPRVILAEVPVQGKCQTGNGSVIGTGMTGFGEKGLPEGPGHEVVDMQRPVIDDIGDIVHVPGGVERVGIDNQYKPQKNQRAEWWCQFESIIAVAHECIQRRKNKDRKGNDVPPSVVLFLSNLQQD
ncbi:hypothetical protein DESC_240090 [Desulfosarcina cetonica]|nr:hypothetical protein DESC_240090 [Desulfosarcina cetonica]